MTVRLSIEYLCLFHSIRLFTMGNTTRVVQVATETTKATKRGHSSDDETTPKKTKKAKSVSGPLDPTVPNNTVFPTTITIPEHPEGAIKIASYNVAGLAACIKKGFKKYVDAEDPDILCLQETKLNEPSSTAVNDKVYKYRYWNISSRKGYAGVAVFSKFKPSSVVYGIPGHEEASRGRVLTLNFSSFTLINCYIPNAGANLVNLPMRQVFDGHMEEYLRSFQRKKIPVIWAGDLNVAHTPDDLARPDTNHKSAGFTDEERADFTKILSPSEDGLPGLIDTWRHLHPEVKGHYTFYGYRFNCRGKLLGWRLDYFTVTPDLMDKVVSSEIRQEVWGASDHVPLVLTLKDITF
ncbi:Endonuclease/exonuclease/phosphatase [Pilobolus umbonatus]|nr:Endonuclease/exonuclease/phosphatase [Pilobolus umbonatus]